MKNEIINWRRFLAFLPVILALVFLSLYGRRFLPEYLMGPIHFFLFFTFFLIFYRSRRWNPNPPPVRTERLWWMLPLIVVVLIIMEWLRTRFPEALPWLTLLMM